MMAGKRGRALAAFAVFALMLFIGWYAGCDYMERGPQQAINVMTAILAGAVAWFIYGVLVNAKGRL